MEPVRPEPLGFARDRLRQREAMPESKGRFHALRIILLGLGAAVAYGIVQDNFTARICPAYFNVAHPDLGHPEVFHHQSPTVLAFAWGVAATWWVGLPLGLLMAIAARAGRWPKLGVGDLLRPVGKLLLVLAGAAILGGVVAWGVGLAYFAPMSIAPEDRAGWGIDWGIHLAAYLVGPIGGLVLCVTTLVRRRRLAREQRSPVT